MTPDPLREALEACRPNSGDLDRPEMAAVRRQLEVDPQWAQTARRLEEVDVRIRDALLEVAPPEGLEGRVLSRLAPSLPMEPAAEEGGTEWPTAAASPASPGPVLVDNGSRAADGAPAGRRRPLARRLYAVAALAAVLVLGLAIWQHTRRPLQVTPGGLAEEAVAWVRPLTGRAPWRPLASAPRQTHPLPAALLIAPRGWKPLETPLDPQAVAYDLRGPGQQAYCVVMVPERRIEGLPGLPPDPPHRDTGGWTVGSWRDQKRIYTLVVRGGAGEYRQLINPQHGWVVYRPQPARSLHPIP